MPDYKRGVMRVAFQVMGVTAGRKDSNCEILLKEALLACREQGAEVRMINLKDYELLDCNGCTACFLKRFHDNHTSLFFLCPVNASLHALPGFFRYGDMFIFLL